MNLARSSGGARRSLWVVRILTLGPLDLIMSGSQLAQTCFTHASFLSKPYAARRGEPPVPSPTAESPLSPKPCPLLLGQLPDGHSSCQHSWVNTSGLTALRCKASIAHQHSKEWMCKRKTARWYGCWEQSYWGCLRLSSAPLRIIRMVKVI